MVLDLVEVLAPIVSADPDVDAAALFGSAATARERPDSDVDIYLRLRPGARWTGRRTLSLAADASRACGREVDLVVEDSSTSVILRREVAAHGRLLYEARPGAWTELRADAVLAYVDLEPYLRRIGESVRAAVRRRG